MTTNLGQETVRWVRGIWVVKDLDGRLRIVHERRVIDLGRTWYWSSVSMTALLPSVRTSVTCLRIGWTTSEMSGSSDYSSILTVT